MGYYGYFEWCVVDFDEIRILEAQNALVNFEILRVFFRNEDVVSNVRFVLFLVLLYIKT